MNQPFKDTAYFPISDDDFYPKPSSDDLHQQHEHHLNNININTSSGSASNFHSDDIHNIRTVPPDRFSELDSDPSVNVMSMTMTTHHTTTTWVAGSDDFAHFRSSAKSNSRTNKNNGVGEDVVDMGVEVDVDVVLDVDGMIQGRDVKVSDSTSTAVELDERDLLERQVEVLDKEEEEAFGVPTEIYVTPTTTSSCTSGAGVVGGGGGSLTNDPTGTNSPTPARHRRVSFDLDISEKDEKSSSRSRRDESVGGTIHCRNSKCGKMATGLEARREFKTCHNCNAYYCSRECRRAHWEKHKKGECRITEKV
jgi:MYND finger